MGNLNFCHFEPEVAIAIVCENILKANNIGNRFLSANAKKHGCSAIWTPSHLLTLPPVANMNGLDANHRTNDQRAK